MQLIEMMDKLWLKDGLDLRMITFKCLHTGIKKGKLCRITVIFSDNNKQMCNWSRLI